jgi:GxxExxY protein
MSTDRVTLDRLTSCIIAGAMKVHSVLGPALLESAYEACLSHELRQRGVQVATQVPMPLHYDGIRLELGYRIDVLVENLIVVEVKSVSKLLPVHRAQLLSYLRFGGFPVGLILNFGEQHLRNGISRFVNGF